MSIVSEVKQRTDIVELVSDYVALQKAGRNFKALCPLHSEKHPSFFVFPEQQTWHCFGACGTGGDVFAFIMKKEGVDFGQALRILAQRAGVALSPPETVTSAEDEQKERLLQINEASAEYYHHLLLNTRVGEPARSYLAKRRIEPETIEGFHLGFSAESWEALKDFLLGKGYEGRELVEAGLIIEREGGSGYDRFRNRLMFPIADIRGRVIGFGARVLDESLPKYMNSPQTAVFDKSSSLYGINRARSAIAQKNLAIVVEGYTDVLRAHQHGWQNVVASMGTSLTDKQVRLVKGLTKNVALALDADAAGEEATLRGAETLAQSLDKKVVPVPTWSGLVRYENTLDTEIRVIPLPQGRDPDEVIAEDPDLWQDLVKKAPLMLDFAFRAIVSKVDLEKAKDKSLAIQKLVPLLGEIRDPIRQAHYQQKLARLLNVREPILVAALRRSQPAKRTSELARAMSFSRLARQSASSPVEEYCLALLLQFPELRHTAKELTAEHFDSSENREIFTTWECFQNSSELRGKLDASLLEHLDYLLDRTFPPDIQAKEETRRLSVTDCILRLREMLSKRLENRMEAILNLEREEEGVDAELAKLEEHGIKPGEQLQEVFVKQGQKTRPKRG